MISRRSLIWSPRVIADFPPRLGVPILVDSGYRRAYNAVANLDQADTEGVTIDAVV